MHTNGMHTNEMYKKKKETTVCSSYCSPTGGTVSPLTLGGERFQVLQCDLFVPGAVGEAVVDHSVLKRQHTNVGHSHHRTNMNQQMNE